jgi:hypothetical protein
MTRLYKLDLEPNEIYNVSLNIKQGGKTVDNLRFFQTQVPKLYNIQTSNFTPFSQIIEKSDPVVKTETGGGLSKDPGTGADQNVFVKNITWTRSVESYERSEGETVIDPSSVKYTFTIEFKGDPKLIGYFVSGFPESLKFLNYKTGYQAIGGNKLQITLSLLEINPTVNRVLKTERNEKSITNALVTSILVQGSTTTLIFNKELKGIVPGKSKGFLQRPGGPPTIYYFSNTTIIAYKKYQNSPARWYVQFDTPSAVKATPGQILNRFDWITPTSSVTFSGGEWKALGQSSSDDSRTIKKPDLSKAKITYQTLPTYSVKQPTVKYKFAKTSYISSAVINPNIIDKLIWEDDVRDYIYFIISDVDKGGDKKKYFFGTFGSINKVASEDESLIGSNIYNPSTPPTAHPNITSSTAKLFKTSTGNVKYYAANATQNNNTSVPALVRQINIQFAVARYIKKGSTWTGKWLSPSSPLSGIEVLQ